MRSREKPANVSRLSPELVLARCAMIQLDVDRGDIAARLGRTPATISNWLCKGFPFEAGRWRFEAALEYQRAIWSKPRDLLLRRRCLQVHGFDPYLVSRPELRDRARRLGVRVLQKESLPSIRKATMGWLAANLPQPQPQIRP